MLLREIEIVLYSSAEHGYFVWRRGLVNCVLYAPLGGIEGQGRVGRSSSFIFTCFYYSYTNIQWMHNNLLLLFSTWTPIDDCKHGKARRPLCLHFLQSKRIRMEVLASDHQRRQYATIHLRIAGNNNTLLPDRKHNFSGGARAFREQSSSLHRCNLATRHRGPSIFVVLLPNPLLPPYTFSNRQIIIHSPNT